MKGKIKTYNADKGFGYIEGEDNNDYFFHISNFKSMETPKRWSLVEFSDSKNDKGFCAHDVLVKEYHKSQIINLNGTRIMIKDIKEYKPEIWDEKYEYRIPLDEIKKELKQKHNNLPPEFRIKPKYNIIDLLIYPSGKSHTEIRTRIRKKLLIKTRQNKDFVFYDNEINIEEKIAELDFLLS